MHCAKRETCFLTPKLFIKQLMQSTFRDEVLRKMETKYGKNCSLAWQTNMLDKTKKQTVAVFRLSGHDCLNSHLCHIGVVSMATCLLSDKNGTMDKHRLFFCWAVNVMNGNNVLPRYWEAQKNLGALHLELFDGICFCFSSSSFGVCVYIYVPRPLEIKKKIWQLILIYILKGYIRIKSNKILYTLYNLIHNVIYNLLLDITLNFNSFVSQLSRYFFFTIYELIPHNFQ